MLLGQVTFAQIWTEDFNAYPNGTTNGPPKWTSNATDCDDGGNLNIGPGESQWGVWDGQFTVNDIEGAPCCPAFGGGGNDNSWLSEVIDISGYCDVSISLDVSAAGDMECDSPLDPIFGCANNTPPDNSQDQFVVEFSLDGGAFTQFAYICAANGVGPVSAAGINGSTLQIRVRVANKSNSEFYYFDNVVVNGTLGPTPLFNQIGPLCENDPPLPLPTTSLNGVSGTWNVGPTFNPAGLGGTTTTITFTPNGGGCSPTATMDIFVNPDQTPTLPALGPFCTDDPPAPLPANPGGISGAWSGQGVVGNNFDPGIAGGNVILTYTPAPGQCAQTTSTNVVVQQTPTANSTTLVECGAGGTAIFDLLAANNLVNSNPTYTVSWYLDPNGALPIPNPSNYTGTNGSTVYAIVANGNCTAVAGVFLSVTTSGPVTISGIPSAMCQTDPPTNLPTNQGGVSGQWAGPGVSANVFNPINQSGITTITFWPLPGQCGDPTNWDIDVTVPGPPAISGIPTAVCVGETTPLPTTQSGITGTWSGTDVVNDTLFPSGNVVGLSTLTFTPDAGQCASPATFQILIEEPGPAVISGIPSEMCQTDPPISLATTQNGVTGTWSGSGVTNNAFDPTGISGLATLTFTPGPGQCTGPASVQVNISEPEIPMLSGVPNIFCETTAPLALPTSQGGYTGNWSGPGVSGNTFDPAGLSGSVTLVFAPTTGTCVTSASLNVTVNLPITPQLGDTTLCETGNIFNLSPLADPAYPAGTWSGPGVSGNNFDPAGQSGTVTLTFTPSATCTNPATTVITLAAPALPQLQTAAICQNGTPLDLGTLADPAYPAGTWSGPGVSSSQFDPTGQSGTVTLTFTPSATCTQAATTGITVNTPPGFADLSEDCIPNTLAFTVSFTLTGGDPASYTVDGNPVGGTTFTSAPIASGTNYSFDIDDANGCGPVTISGSENCACTTDAGSMDPAGTPLQVCEGSDFTVNHNGDENIGPNDLLQFVLHDNAGAQLGNVVAVSNSTTFPFPAGVVMGQTYYVSAVAGLDDGTGNVDLNDPCLSVTQGVPVVFYRPTVQLGGGGSICPDECFDLNLQFTGSGPFEIAYSVEVNGTVTNQTATGLGSNTVLTLCPGDFVTGSGTLVFEIENLTDANGCTADPAGLPAAAPLTVLPEPLTNLAPTLCPGESIVVNGTQYDETNPSGAETFPDASVFGCDSIVSINLTFLPPAEFNLAQTLCAGSSLTVNGTVYDEGNPSGTEVLPNASTNGCDSTIYVNLTFTSAVTETLNPTLCPGGSVTVNGTVYDEGNPTGSETFPGGSFLGCDSVVNVSLSFFQPAEFDLVQMLCEGGSLTVNGTVYDEGNPTGTEILPNASANGCDSIVYVNLTFTSAVTGTLDPTLCPGSSVTVNGTVYDEGNPTGSETFPGGSYLGCDSIVNVSLTFFQPAEFNLNQTLCEGGSLTVNGTVYDEDNPTGTEVLPNASVNACDSIVYVNLTFTSAVTETLASTLCPGGSVTVNGTVYDEGNPTGSETFPGGSYLGCDSIVNVSLTFFQPAEFDLEEVFCTGGSVTVNGTVYDETNPTGTEILPNASVNGCDSIVYVNLTFGQVIVDLDTVLCPGESVFINGTLYFSGNTSGTETFPGGSYLGCDSTVNVSLFFYPEAIFTLEETLEPGQSVVVNGMTFDQTNPSGVVVIAGGSYTGCDSTVFVMLTFEAKLVADVELISPTCLNGNDGSIVLNGISGGTPPYVVALNGANSMQVTDFPVVFNDLDAGFHQLTLQDATSLTVLNLLIPEPPELVLDLGDDLTINLGESVTLSPSASFQIASSTWSPPDFLDCGDCLEPTVQAATEDVTYTLVATDANGCTAEDRVTIFVQKVVQVYVPNAFSPNGDGFNDRLTVFAGPQVARVKTFKLFDRWGNFIYEFYNLPPNDVGRGWDGTFKGEEMGVGVYVWFAEVEFLDGEVQVFKGDVMLLR